MPDDNRLDLSGELDKINAGFAADVSAAAEEVRKRQAADKAKEDGAASRAQSRKTSAVIIAVAAVLLLLLSYWLVFARGGGDEATSGATAQATSPQVPATGAANSPALVTPAAPKAPPKAYAPVGGGGAQNVEQPPQGYEQPGDDGPGM